MRGLLFGLVALSVLFPFGETNAEQWQRTRSATYFEVKATLKDSPRKEREALAQGNCASAVAQRQRELALSWCLLGFDSYNDNPVLLENAAMMVLLYGGDGSGSDAYIERLIKLSSRTGDASLALRAEVLAYLLHARIQYAHRGPVRFDTNFTSRMATRLGLQITATRLMDQRIELAYAIAKSRQDREGAWALAGIAATAVVVRESEYTNAPQPYEELHQAIGASTIAADKLPGFESGILMVTAFHRAQLAGQLDDAKLSAAAVTDAAARCPGLVWRDSEPCRDLRFRAAVLTETERLRSIDPDHFVKRRPKLATSYVWSGDVLDPPCQAVYSVDVSPAGKVVESRTLYMDPPICAQIGADYLASLLFQIGGTPGAPLTEYLVAFNQRWP